MATFLAVLVVSGPAAPVLAQDAFFLTVPDVSDDLSAAKDDKSAGIDFTLTAATPPDIESQKNIVATGEPLSAEKIESLVKRLPDLAPQTEKPFRLPEQSLVRPKLPGTEKLSQFPPVADEKNKGANDAAKRPARPAVQAVIPPLTITRMSPEGQIDTVGEVSVSFSQPMVPLAEVKVADPSAFLTLAPQPAGQWEWAGTQTLLFHPGGAYKRLPRATTYRLTVPKGVKAVTGAQVSVTASKTVTIKTPVLRILSTVPGAQEPMVQDPTIFLTFNQDIDQKAVLPFISLTSGKQLFPLRLATDAEIAASKDKVGGIDSSFLVKKQWLAVHPVQPLPLGLAANLVLSANAPSAEGPDKTTTPQSVRLRVHGPLRLTDSPKNGVTAGRRSMGFSFNNHLAEKGQDLKSLVKISPLPREFEIARSYNGFSLFGDFRPFEKYTVAIDAALKDAFDQTLGHDVTCTWTTGAKDTMLTNGYKSFVTIAPGQKPAFNFFAQATDKVTAWIYKIKPGDFSRYENIVQQRYYGGNDDGLADVKKRLAPCLVATKNYPVGNDGVSVDVDFAPYLKDGHGQFFVLASCPDKVNKQQLSLVSYVQVTALGVDVFQGKDGGVNAYISSLNDGKPLDKCKVSLKPDNLAGTSDSTGLAVMSQDAKSRGDQGDGDRFVSVTHGSDAAILMSNSSGWSAEPSKPTINWFCVTDRALYRPGDTINVKGWQRGFKYDDGSAIRLFSTNLRTVNYTVTASDNTQLASGEANVDASGGFAFTAPLPKNLNLGEVSITVKAPADQLPGFGTNDTVYDNAGQTSSVKNYATTFNVAVEEFRRPEFEMKVSTAKPEMLIGETAKLTANASYFGGGAMPLTKVQWTVRASYTQFTPPNWSEYSFGGNRELPFRGRRFAGSPIASSTTTHTLETLSDSHGAGAADVCVNRLTEPRPVSLQCEATFTDVNRQQWSDHTTITNHPSSLYVGFKAAVNEPRQDKLAGKIVVVDKDGKIAPNRPVHLAFTVTDRDGKDSEVAKLDLVSADKPVDFGFDLPTGQRFALTARVKDDAGHANETYQQFWVNRIDAKLADQGKENASRALTVKADKNEYQAGESAAITVTSPFYPAHGLLLVSRHGLVSTQPLDLSGASQMVNVPVSEDDYPGLIVEALLNGKNYAYGSAQLSLFVPPLKKNLKLTVSPERDALAPGSETSVNVALKDIAGAPVKDGHVAVAIVDESVFALREYKWPTPNDIFYPSSAQAALRSYLRQTILLKPSAAQEATKEAAAPPPSPPGGVDGYANFGNAASGGMLQESRMSDMALAKPVAAPMMMGGAAPARMMARMKKADASALAPAAAMPAQAQAESEGEQTKFAARTNFSELALFAPDVVTDQNGLATVKFKLPDSTTKYRIMAAAVAGEDKSGLCEATLTTRMDLAVKPSLPRFLSLGDRCELPFVVQNQTDKPLKAEVVLRLQNAELVGPAGKTVDVPANSRVEVRFPVVANAQGNIDVQCAASADNLSDAATLSIPVMVPATLESFATYGQIDKGAVEQKLVYPRAIYPNIGGLKLSTSSTALQSLTDAYTYLRDYQFDCSEQISAKALAMLSLHDALAAFGMLKSDAEIAYKGNINKCIELLLSRQNADGSFGLWKAGERETYPYVSMQVDEALMLAARKGYEVPKDKLALCDKYLREIEKHIPADYSLSCKQAIRARALNARYLQGDVDGAGAKKLIGELKGVMSLEMAAWLLPVLSRAGGAYATGGEAQGLRRQINNSIKETASTASTNDTHGDFYSYLLFSSPRRTDALTLLALIQDDSKSELIAKLAKGLLAHRKNGAWDGTQENWVVLQALDKYFSTYEKATPDFTASAWLDDTFIGSNKFVGRETETRSVEIPSAYLLSGGGASAGKTVSAGEAMREILINKEGPGRLYYRLGIDYAPLNLKLAPASFGFNVSKTYEAVDKKDEVSQDKDGVWHFKAGASVRCKVHFSNIGERYHVALMAPLPGGCEPVNSALAGNKSSDGGDEPPHIMPVERGFMPMHRGWWWWREWYEHQNLRDHQAEAFASLLNAGDHDYSYMMRATTPGRFIVSPTKLEEMYATETFGRTGSETVVIE